jgi:hypothetical protein
MLNWAKDTIRRRLKIPVKTACALLKNTMILDWTLLVENTFQLTWLATVISKKAV